MGRCIGHDDRILVAHNLAQPTCHALLRDDFRHLVMARARVRRVVFHVNAVERTNIDAELTTRAVVHDDFRLRDLARLDARDEVAVLVLDARNGAINRAHPAVDTAFGVNDIQLFRLAADRVHRTFQLANGAADASVCDKVRHGVTPFRSSDPTRPSLRKLSQAL